MTEPGNTPFEEIEHTADWALRIRGQDLRALLINAARGMNSLLYSDSAEGSLEVEEQIVLEAIDTESLLVDWLSELAYWAEMERVLFQEFDLPAVSSTRLEANLRGRQVDALQKHIKAVTYHNLEIVTTPKGHLEAVIVFDV